MKLTKLKAPRFSFVDGFAQLDQRPALKAHLADSYQPGAQKTNFAMSSLIPTPREVLVNGN